MTSLIIRFGTQTDVVTLGSHSGWIVDGTFKNRFLLKNGS